MNELQIRLSADIKQFQAAMAQVESRLERAENILKKAQVSADRYRGALATLAGQFKRGEISQEQYNKGAEKLSSSLIKQEGIISNTTREVDRLNKEYKRMNTSSLVQGQNQLATSTDNLTDSLTGTNSISNSLSRTFRDLPGGITPLFENIRQLSGNFSNLTKTAGGVGPAIAKTISSMVTPANLALLAISALTAAFTAYQMGAFKSRDATKDLEEELNKYKETLDRVNSSRLDSLKSADSEIVKINSLRSIIEDETASREDRNKAINEIQKSYPQYFANLSKEQILAGQVGDAYERITKQLIARSQADSAIKQIVELNNQERLLLEKNKDKLDEINEVRKRIAVFQEQANKAELEGLEARDKGEKALALLRQTSAENQIRFLRRQNEEVDKLLTIEEQRNKLTGITTQALKDSATAAQSIVPPVEDLSEKTNKAAEQARKLREEWEKFLMSGVNEYSEIDKWLASFTDRLNNFKISSREPIDLKINLGDAPIQEFAEELETVQTKVTDNTAQIASAFSGMSFQVSEALGISNRNLRAFVGTVISNAPKIISAIMAQAKAAQAAAIITNSANLAQAKGNAVVSATAAAKGLGPVGLALLPVFIAGALALVAGAFGKGGGGKGGGGASPSISGKSQSFGNLPQPTRQEMRDQSTSSSNRPNGPNRLEAVVTGDQIRFVLDQSGRRTGRG